MWSNQQYFITEGDENKRVINSNDAVSIAVDKWKAANASRLTLPESEVEGNPEYVEAVDGELSEDELAVTTDEDGFTEGIARFQKESVDYEALAKEKAKEIIALAKAESDRIIEQALLDANSQAEAIKSSAHKSGFEEGLANGQTKAQEMLDLEKSRLDQERNQLNRDYEARLSTMESELIDAIIIVFQRVFGVQFADKKDILVYLVSNTLRNVDNANEFKIRINNEALDTLQANMSVLEKAVGSDVSLELVTDASLDVNACVIETENGIFDCSLDVQLDNLIRDIKSLSLRTV